MGKPLVISTAGWSGGVLNVHGLEVSSSTGKLEGYLRNKGIVYRLVPMDYRDYKRCAKATGVAQMPQVEWGAGQWLTDTTLIIEYLEKLYAHNTVTLTDPFMQFMVQLLEDFGDEWVKRSSVCHRWSHLNDARLVSAQLADSVLGDLAVPNPLKRWAILRRQRTLFLKREGCTSRTVQRLLSHYIQLLDALEPVLASQPFVFGQRPTLADYGLFGPMFRHFFSDPTPARILKNRAPAVQEWIARLWNCRLDELSDKPMPVTMPAASSGLWSLVESEYFPYMQANEAAFLSDRSHCEFKSGGVTFKVPVHTYRVWRFQRLRQRFHALSPECRSQVAEWMPSVFSVLFNPVPRLITPPIAELPLGSSNPVSISA
ncbi:MAG TPA: glutathione S-transferase family protein [Limnobacter sp.]|uniref:glutathione S-transferase family protein n=1 Tax=Limnobacter sp. TaxID=2003368 RepID=UPI002E314A6F|nr:glutathione S-transferase family protein [Limnobacter sp.]HEX5485268.1 glutathione S-transferase family protein [Limnobacter sp.]